jgi:EmrB/QacA subfamily drug resistance transporter
MQNSSWTLKPGSRSVFGVRSDLTVTGWRRVLVEAPRASRLEGRPGTYWLAVASVSIGAFMGQLDASIVSLAYPTIRHDFHAGIDAVQWVGLSYLLTLGALLVPVGQLADNAGRKLLYVWGFALFAVASVLCAAAPSLLALDGFRALQGVGAAMLQANSVAIIALAVPASRLGKALGFQGTAQALGLALGPPLGGFLIAAAGWRLIFLLNAPIGLLGITAALLFISPSGQQQPRHRLDILGVTLLAPALAALLIALSLGERLRWTSTTILALLTLAATATTCFVRHEHRSDNPLVDPRLFAHGRFRIALTTGTLAYVVLYGFLFITPFYLEADRHLKPATAGLLLLALSAALAAVTPIAGHLTDRYGAKRPTLAGITLATAAAATLVATSRHTTSLLALGAELALLGAGLGLFIPANNTQVMQSAPAAQTGSASGILNTARTLGIALGLTLTTITWTATRNSYTAATALLAIIALSTMTLASNRSPTAGGARAKTDQTSSR